MNRILEHLGTEYQAQDVGERVFVRRQRVKFEYAWSTGVAVGRFLRELKRGRLIGRRCPECQRVLVPPRMFCEQCYRPTREWIPLKDTGVVQTYSVSHVASDASRLPEPILVAVISLDGAAPGTGILHLLGEVRSEQVEIGMRVQAVWRAASMRRGSITDIKYFRPIRRS